MKNALSPSQAELFGLSRSEYHAVLLESGLHNGQILQIQQRTPYEIYILVEGSITSAIQILVRRIIKIIQHEDGVTTDYLSGSIEFPKKNEHSKNNTK